MADGYEGSILNANVFWVRTKPNGEWVSVLALKGEQGTPGRNGNDGRIYVPTFDGRYLTWELRERPPSGETFSMDLRGPIGEPGPAGPVGPTGPRGPQGERGERGESAFDQAVQAGYEGTARAFYDALAAVVETGETAQKAIDLAKKNNHAHLFETRAEFDLWIADPQMTNTINVGDFLFIKETSELYTWDGDSVVPLPSPAEHYPTEDEINAWLEAAGEVREGVCTCAKAAASSAEAAASSARLSSAQALNAVNAANGAADSAKAAAVSAEQAQEAKAGAEAAKSGAEAAKQGADTAKAGAESAKASAEAKAQESATSATQAAQSATAAAGSATQAEEAKAAVEETAEWAGRWKLEETNAAITGSDGIFLYTGNDTGFAGDGTHYFVLTAIDAKTCRLQVFEIVYENSPFSVPPRHDLVLPFGLGDKINVYLAAAIMGGALFVRYYRMLYKFSLPDGALIAKIPVLDGYTAFNFRTGHILCDNTENNGTTRVYDADLVELTQKPGYVSFSTLFYLYGTAYATRNKRLEWLDDEDVWQAAVDANGEEMTCGSNVSGVGTLWNSFSVYRKKWDPSFTDAAGKKRLCLNLFNGYQKWQSTGIAEDGTAVFTKNGTMNKTQANTTGVIGAREGPGMFNGGKTTLFNKWDQTSAVIYSLNYASFVPPILEPPEGKELVNNIYWIHLIGRVNNDSIRHNQIYAIRL